MEGKYKIDINTKNYKVNKITKHIIIQIKGYQTIENIIPIPFWLNDCEHLKFTQN